MKLVSSKSTRDGARKGTDAKAPVKRGKSKKGGSRAALAVCLVLVLIICGAAAWAAVSAHSCDTVLPNVYAWGVSLGGLSQAEAEEHLTFELESVSTEISVEFPGGKTMRLTKSDMLKSYNAKDAASAAWNYGRRNGKVSVLSYIGSLGGKKELFGDGIDEAKLKERIAETAAEVNSSLVDSAYTVNGSSLTIVKGASGMLVDEDEVYRLVCDAVESGKYGTVEYTPSSTEPESLSVDDIHKLVCREPKNAEFNDDFSVTESRVGLTFDIAEAKRLYDAAEDGTVITVPLETIEPETSTEELSALLYRDKLASWTSSLTANETRSKNIELAAKEVDGYQMMPGDVFSFNDVVGERTTARGFGGAPAYINGQTVDQVGGGICQVSSSIYYCCLLANLKTVYRICHLYAASYVPLGMDATVSWGGPDFKFSNNTEYPIKICAWREGGKLYCEIYGTKTDDTHVEMTYSVTETYNYDVKYEEDASVAPGRTKTKTYGITGYRVETYKSVYDGDGKRISQALEDVSVYSKRDQVVLVAPGELYLYDPSVEPPEPSAEPSPEPTEEPMPSTEPDSTPEPSAEPSSEPTEEPTPTTEPGSTPEPGTEPMEEPAPSTEPSPEPAPEEEAE